VTRPGRLDDAIAAVEVTLEEKEVTRPETPYRPRPVLGYS
jgi:hypothetical protein